MGGSTLATYTYKANNGKLASMTYANGTSVEYVYDALDNIAEIRYNGSTSPAYSYTYASGQIATVTDHTNSRKTSYTYNNRGNVSRVLVSTLSGTALYALEYDYDEYDVPITCNYAFFDDGGTWYEVKAVYNADNRQELAEYITTYGDSTVATIAYSYDSLKRLDWKQLTGGNMIRTESYEFFTNDTTHQTTTQVESYTVTVKKASTGGQTYSAYYSYGYYSNGSIASVSETVNGTSYVITYDYDSLGRLVRENNQRMGHSYTYAYDAGHNITEEKRYAFTTGTLGAVQERTVYTYSGDKLTGKTVYDANGTEQYGGFTTTYDAVGNPDKWGYYGYLDLNWTKGRQLASIDDYGGLCTYRYTYNEDGVRISKELVDRYELHEYVVSGTTILRELIYDTSSGSKVLTYALYYGYDEAGAISHVTVKSGTTSATFYYVKNLQGDVVAITDSNGAVLVQYRYDAWGDWNWTFTSGLTGLSQYIASYNPFRYRGYYYDDESGFYYLNSRYYDPEVGRFLNGDVYISTGQGLTGYNMYVYCGNNPVLRQDNTGNWFHIAIGAAVGFLIGGIGTFVSEMVENDGDISKVDWIDVGISAIAGGGMGAVTATLGPGVAVVAIGAASAALETATSQILDYTHDEGFDADLKKLNAVEIAQEAAIGAITSIGAGTPKGISKHMFAMGKNLEFTKASFKYYFSQTYTLYYQKFKNEKIGELVVSIVSPLIEEGAKHALNAEE